VVNYETGHRDRINYASRLVQGKSIGSGMIKGTIKQMLGRRLKQTGSRRNVKQVAPLVKFIPLDGGTEWETYWADA